MRYQGYCNSSLGVENEPETSMFVELDRNPDTNPSIFVDCTVEPSRTRQEFAADCDINNIMAQYQTTGFLPNNLNTRDPQYLDLSNTPTRLQDALALVEEARTAFMQLPAQLRREMDNDPVNFVAWAQNPENADELRKYGLAEPLPVDPVPMKVEIINPAQEPAKGSKAASED